ncbi:tyrosinase family oxidase copper chaperone [Streptomyces sp. NPDC052225]|uniref:tyrosinase family oxidase copper chaperone n=1 Tax=Streptomyces sp. NPDC052225 TaxID=3154949 RepID=UPI00342D674B
MNSHVTLLDLRAPRKGENTEAATGREPGTGPLLTRRSASLILLGVVSSVATVVHVRSQSGQGSVPDTETFDETYLGRRITGAPLPVSGTPGSGAWQVTVDGRPLHLMRRADGSYLSMVDHYTSYPTALAATRGAVVELGTQALQAHGPKV